MRRLRWICLLFFIFDESRGYCVGDLLEEYEEISKRDGKVKAIKWLCKQVISSSSYLIRKHPLSALTWFRNSLARVVSLTDVKGLRIVLISSALCLLLFISLFYFYSTRKNSLRAKLDYREIVSEPDLTDPNIQTAVLVPGLVRSAEPTNRIEVPPSTAILRVHLHVLGGEVGKSYQVRLTNIDAGEVFTVKGLKCSDNKIISINLPARVIPSGDYMLTVSNAEDGSIYDRQNYYFRVLQKSNTRSISEE